MHYDSEQPDIETYNHPFFYKLGSERVSKQMNEHNGARKQSEQCSPEE